MASCPTPRWAFSHPWRLHPDLGGATEYPRALRTELWELWTSVRVLGVAAAITVLLLTWWGSGVAAESLWRRWPTLLDPDTAAARGVLMIRGLLALSTAMAVGAACYVVVVQRALRRRVEMAECEKCGASSPRLRSGSGPGVCLGCRERKLRVSDVVESGGTGAVGAGERVATGPLTLRTNLTWGGILLIPTLILAGLAAITGSSWLTMYAVAMLLASSVVLVSWNLGERWKLRLGMTLALALAAAWIVNGDAGLLMLAAVAGFVALPRWVWGCGRGRHTEHKPAGSVV